MENRSLDIKLKHLKTYENIITNIKNKLVDLAIENNPKNSIFKSNHIFGVTKDNPGIDISQKYPKYIIWKTKDELFILKVIKVILGNHGAFGREVENSILKKIYSFKNNIIKKLHKKDRVTLRDIFRLSQENIIYQSNNLQDCLEKLPIILNSEKYNL